MHRGSAVCWVIADKIMWAWLLTIRARRASRPSRSTSRASSSKITQLSYVECDAHQ
jgi:hypothetical protein